MKRFIFFILIFILAVGGLFALYYKTPIRSWFTRTEITDTYTPPTQDNSIAELQGQISELNENVNMLLCVVADKEYQIQVMSVNLDDAYAEIDSQNRALDTLCNEIDLKNTTISQLETEKAQLQAEYNELSQDLADHEERLTQIEQCLTTITNELVAINSDLTNLQAQTNIIETRLDELDELVASQSASIETIETELENINAEITNIQSQIEDMQSSLDDLTASAVQIVESGTGYIKYSDGTLIQYGKLTVNKEAWFNFPTSFIDTNFTMSMVSHENSSNGAYVPYASYLAEWGGYIFLYKGSSTAAGNVSYFAIGRWK